MSTALRSIPAAFRLRWNWPPTPLLRSKLASPVPVSMTMSLEPVLMTIGVYGIVIMSFSMYAAASAPFTWSFWALRTKVSGNLKVLRPSVTAVIW